jgi:hypothetical protein
MGRYELEREAWWRVVMGSKYESSWGGCCFMSLSECMGGFMKEYYEGLEDVLYSYQI